MEFESLSRVLPVSVDVSPPQLQEEALSTLHRILKERKTTIGTD